MGGDPLVELADRLQAACLAAGSTVALAESCTGGMVAAAITEVAGSSGYFVGGIVSYANEAKRDLLGIDPAILAAHGAVSAQVARAMATGARERFGATLAASVTGIAGPDGGSAAKPVGLTYIGVADADGVDVRRIVWSGDRSANRRDSTIAVLEMLVGRVEQTESPPILSTAGRAAGPDPE
ncbi:MAG: nicotinamide-nucleotide amidase [Chloroflexota bacterium]|jgi:nicotinamide-nucleotide amidase|nr:nicotinamide-nucleotide amidase [Chloroflexota bacterium]MEA2606909.1 nicotinamide-nucleotide amidase [Chloroflexota bacterium]